MEWTVQTLADTAAVANDTLQSLQPAATATVIALHGDLGAGKTTFVQLLAKQLGVSDVLTSPTFVIMKAYETMLPWEQLVHIDAYRVEDQSEMTPLGFTTLLQQPHTLVCIEWAERIAELLPADTLHLSFTLVDERRLITTQYG